MHTNLLKVSGEAVHVLIVGQESLRLKAEKVVVPDAKHGENDGRLVGELRTREEEERERVKIESKIKTTDAQKDKRRILHV